MRLGNLTWYDTPKRQAFQNMVPPAVRGQGCWGWGWDWDWNWGEVGVRVGGSDLG